MAQHGVSMNVNPTFGRQRQEDLRVKSTLYYRGDPISKEGQDREKEGQRDDVEERKYENFSNIFLPGIED